MKDDSSKVLLVGPSYKIADYGIDYFENKRREGYKILSYTGSILYFREIGFAPDYFSWFDPTSVVSQSWSVITESGDFFKNTDMVTSDLFYDQSTLYKKYGMSTSTPMNQKNYRKITEELPKFFNKCYWYKVRVVDMAHLRKQSLAFKQKHKYEHLLKARPRKARELKNKIRNIEASEFEGHKKHGFPSPQIPDFKQHFHLIHSVAFHGPSTYSTDKLTSLVLPLVLYHFGDSLDEIRLLGFGDFKERDREGEKREPEPYRTGDSVPYSQDQHDQFIRSFKFLYNHYYSDYLQKEKIKLSFENENSYSRIVEGLK